MHFQEHPPNFHQFVVDMLGTARALEGMLHKKQWISRILKQELSTWKSTIESLHLKQVLHLYCCEQQQRYLLLSSSIIGIHVTDVEIKATMWVHRLPILLTPYIPSK